MPTANTHPVYRQRFHSEVVWNNIMIYPVTVCEQIPEVQTWKANRWLQFSIYKLKKKLTYPNNMVHSVDIAVTHINSDCSDGEAILFSWTVNYYGLTRTCSGNWWITAGRWISGGWRIRWQGMRRHRTSQRRNTKHIWKKNICLLECILSTHEYRHRKRHLLSFVRSLCQNV